MMTGSEPHLKVYLGKTQIAKLTMIDDQLHWHYNQSWQQSGYAVSPHLPLHSDSPTVNVQRFLRNLLPEGHGFEELLNIFHLSRHNTFGLVRALGLDTPGALLFLAAEQSLPTTSFFRSIITDELIQRLDQRDEFGLIIWDGKPRLSVAGVQDKINVVVNVDGELGFGEGELCSTHILKFEKQKLSHLVLNEYITMQLAKHCGLNVATVRLVNYGKHPALLIERFDRKIISYSSVKHRHIIDGCQALNLPPEYKYERNFGNARDVVHIREGASIIKLFDFTHHCVNPAQTKQHILDWVLFNILIFNFDAHGKNISFFIGANGITLAPFYDLVNIKMYPGFEQEMAMGVGDEFDGNAIRAYQLANFADQCQLSRSFVSRRLTYIIKKLIIALDVITQGVASKEEAVYVNRYKSMVRRQCKQLLSQVNDINTIEL